MHQLYIITENFPVNSLKLNPFIKVVNFFNQQKVTVDDHDFFLLTFIPQNFCQTIT